MTDDDAILTVAEVARALRVSTWAIYERIRRHEIPSVHVGRAVRVPRVWLDRTLNPELDEVAS